MESVKFKKILVFASICAALSVPAAAEFGPIRGTLGQKPKKSVPAKVEKTVPAEPKIVPAEAVPEKFDDEQISEIIDSLPPIFQVKGDFFDVFSEDQQAARHIAQIAKKIESHVSAILKWKRGENGAAIEVWADLPSTRKEATSPDVAIENPQDTNLKISEMEAEKATSGDVASLRAENADIPAENPHYFTSRQNLSTKNWTCSFAKNPAEIDDFEIAYLLTGTLLRQLVKDGKIAFPQGNPPAWLACAIAEESCISQAPGKQLLLRQRFDKIQPMNFEHLVAQEISNDVPADEFRANAFWLYRALRNDRKNSLSENVESICKIPVPALKTLAKSADTKDFQLIWAAQFYAAKLKMPAGTESPAESRERFEKSQIFALEINGRETQVSAENLPPIVSQNSTKLLIYRRLAEILNALPTTNPLWHNAFTELGAYYELLSKPEPQAKLAAGTPWAARKDKLIENHKEKIASAWSRVAEAAKLAGTQTAEIERIFATDVTDDSKNDVPAKVEENSARKEATSPDVANQNPQNANLKISEIEAEKTTSGDVASLRVNPPEETVPANSIEENSEQK